MSDFTHLSDLVDKALAEAVSGCGQAQAHGELVEALSGDAAETMALRYAVAIVRGERRRGRVPLEHSDLLAWVRGLSDAGLDLVGVLAEMEAAA